MEKRKFDPGKALGEKLLEMDRRELCEFAGKLCAQIKEEAGTRAYRGGIYPDNISLDGEGRVAIGPARRGGWRGQELQFLAPELYWNGKRGSYSDVYSVGLLLYYAVNKGKLPYEGQCQDPQLRRMGGENFPAPKAAGRRLGEIIEKATRFSAEERYKNIEELQIILESLVKNLYLNGAPSAEAIFKKSDDDLTDLERIMVDIIEKGDAETALTEDEASAAEAEQAAAAEEQEDVRVYEPVQKRAGPAATEGFGPRQPVPILTEEKNPELAPVVPLRQTPVTPAVQYGKSAERERKIAAEAKKRKRRPAVVILVLCVVLIVVALVGNAMLRDFAWQDERQSPAPGDQGGIPSPGPGGAVIIGFPSADSPSPEEGGAAGHSARYEIVFADVSWTQARARCQARGGHLAVISDQEELDEIIALAEEKDASRLWIGMHREDENAVWETDEEIDFYPWDEAAGEPSFTDSYDGAAEDYVMLWNHNNGWYYNDSRNDPVSAFPQVYGGTMGFVCEYEDVAD